MKGHDMAMLPQRDWTEKPENKIAKAVDCVMNTLFQIIKYGVLAALVMAVIWALCVSSERDETERQATEAARRQRHEAEVQLRAAVEAMNGYFTQPGTREMCVTCSLADPQIGHLFVTMTDTYAVMPRGARLLYAERLLSLWKAVAGANAAGLTLESIDGNKIGGTGFSGMTVRD
jgi:hypothetical protein